MLTGKNDQHQHGLNKMNFPRILALDVAGIPRAWATHEDVACWYAKDRIAWDFGDDFRLHGGINRITNQRTFLDVKTIVAVHGMNKNTKTYNTPKLTNRSLFARDQQICGYCGNQFALNKLTRDHIHPISKGGKDKWSNVITACRPCNHRKGNKDIDEISMKLLYIPYVPDYAEHMILTNRHILADQMEFLKKMIKNKNSRILS